MKFRTLRHIPAAVGVAVFLMAVAGPTVGLVASCIADGESPAGGFSVTARQWGLLAKSVWLAGLGAVVTLIVSIPGAYVVGHAGRLSRRPVLATACWLPRCCLPPMVYVFGWQRLLPGWVPDVVQCVGEWALWAYPIPAMVIGAGWSRSGRAAYDAALLDAKPSRAFVRGVLPILWPHALVAGLVLLAIFMGDYGVPHACGLMVYATELLGAASESGCAIDTLWPSLPGTAVIFAAAVGSYFAWRRFGVSVAADHRAAVAGGVSGVMVLLVIAGVAVAVVLPVGSLVAGLRSANEMSRAVGTYGGALLGSAGLVLLGGLAVVLMGVGVTTLPRMRRAALVWALVFGALPGALVGEAVLCAYRVVPVVYDHWSLVLVGYVARFGWVGLVVAWLAERSAPVDLVDQVRVDGGDEAAATLHVRVAASWPVLLFAVALVGALSLAEIAATSLLQVPGLGLVAHILLEKFHRPEGGMLNALSLWLVLGAFPAAVMLAVALRRTRNGELRVENG